MSMQPEMPGVEVAAREVAGRVLPGEIPVGAIYREPRRYQVRFPDHEAYAAAEASTPPTKFRTALTVPRRSTLAIEVPAGVSGPLTALQNEIATLNHFILDPAVQWPGLRSRVKSLPQEVSAGRHRCRRGLRAAPRAS
jgi:hypothetical protein